jgi:hypothetical protein
VVIVEADFPLWEVMVVFPLTSTCLVVLIALMIMVLMSMVASGLFEFEVVVASLASFVFF